MLRKDLPHLWLQEPALAPAGSGFVKHHKAVVGSYDHRSQVVAVPGFYHHQIRSSIAKSC
jgi:hypothetical protein